MSASFPTPQEILKNLSDAFGPSGHEDDVRAYISSLIKPLVDDLREDALGNLIACRKGASDKKLMLDAHMDEIGIMVRFIDRNGFIRFATIGGWDDRLFAGQRVKFKSREGKFYHGVIGMAPPHVLTEAQRGKSIAAEDYFVDVGATSDEDCEKRGICVGDPGVLEYPFMKMTDDIFIGKAFDDRAGCLVQICLLKALADGKIKTPLSVYANFATSEEVGLRGAHVAAYSIDPDVAIALEGTIGSDFPGVPEERQPCAQRKGPVICVIDKSIIIRKKMSEFLFQCAKDAGVPYQIKMPIFGGTDAGSIHQTRGGVLTGVVAVPCRYIHSPNTTLYWPDFEQTMLLMERAVSSIHTLIQ